MMANKASSNVGLTARRDTIVVKLAKNGKYYWSVIAPNGKVLATSEPYSSKIGCLRSVTDPPYGLGWLTLTRKE